MTLSHRLGCIGLLERENAALLNAALAGLARGVRDRRSTQLMRARPPLSCAVVGAGILGAATAPAPQPQIIVVVLARR